MSTVTPDPELGRAVAAELRRHGGRETVDNAILESTRRDARTIGG